MTWFKKVLNLATLLGVDWARIAFGNQSININVNQLR